MLQQAIGGLIRHLLTSFGGALMTGGVMTESDIAAIAGGVATIVGVGWSWWQKRQAVKA